MKYIPLMIEGEARGRGANMQGDVAFQNAEAASQQGNANEETQRRRNAMRMGDLRARAVETGFDPGSGSLATMQTSSAAELELDALTARYESDLRALSFANEGRVYRYNASSARKTGYLNAASSMMSDATMVYGATSMPSGGRKQGT